MPLNDGGDPVHAVVVGGLVYQVAHDPLALGLLGQREVIPNIEVALFASEVVDRTDRKLASVRSLAILLAAPVSPFAFEARVGVQHMSTTVSIGAASIRRTVAVPAVLTNSAPSTRALPRASFARWPRSASVA
ncbi:MAG: hypothetical protein ABI910_13310 [Gemmatimonadota bacterium]